ncbi:hypothetical protein B0A48_16204 [Cryoendolithus antarcticus]|uniref:Uncharacterized protein n=1 Tax=Cryoendolithus antarcticus TaxID=1507870 RepID=A0A1V8SFM6_9PEZI|nr:hypothetical protein B0A48_16204 [Cryoendolithus antarcticus]
MKSAVSTELTTLTIPNTFTPADSCTRQAFQLYPFGLDRLAVNSTTRTGHGYTAIYTTTVITRGVASECYPTQYELLGKTIKPSAASNMGVAKYVVSSYGAESCPPAFVAYIGNPTSATAAVTTCCPRGMGIITTTGPVQSPYVCSQMNQGPVTIDFGSYTTIVPTETSVGIIGAAVFIAPRQIAHPSSGTSETTKIALGVGFAAVAALMLGAGVLGSIWWRRRSRRSRVLKAQARHGFELLGK